MRLLFRVAGGEEGSGFLARLSLLPCMRTSQRADGNVVVKFEIDSGPRCASVVVQDFHDARNALRAKTKRIPDEEVIALFYNGRSGNGLEAIHKVLRKARSLSRLFIVASNLANVFDRESLPSPVLDGADLAALFQLPFITYSGAPESSDGVVKLGLDLVFHAKTVKASRGSGRRADACYPRSHISGTFSSRDLSDGSSTYSDRSISSGFEDSSSESTMTSTSESTMTRPSKRKEKVAERRLERRERKSGAKSSTSTCSGSSEVDDYSKDADDLQLSRSSVSSKDRNERKESSSSERRRRKVDREGMSESAQRLGNSGTECKGELERVEITPPPCTFQRDMLRLLQMQHDTDCIFLVRQSPEELEAEERKQRAAHDKEVKELTRKKKAECLARREREKAEKRAVKAFVYVDEDDIDEDLLCPICYEPFTNGVTHTSNLCLNTFCKSCVVDLTSCPMCRDSIEEEASLAPIPRMMLNLLNKLAVYCSQCQKQLARGDWDAHADEDCCLPHSEEEPSTSDEASMGGPPFIPVVTRINEVRAHSWVLSAASRVFHELFESGVPPPGVLSVQRSEGEIRIALSDSIRTTAVQHLLTMLYSGTFHNMMSDKEREAALAAACELELPLAISSISCLLSGDNEEAKHILEKGQASLQQELRLLVKSGKGFGYAYVVAPTGDTSSFTVVPASRAMLRARGCAGPLLSKLQRLPLLDPAQGSVVRNHTAKAVQVLVEYFHCGSFEEHLSMDVLKEVYLLGKRVHCSRLQGLAGRAIVSQMFDLVDANRFERADPIGLLLLAAKEGDGELGDACNQVLVHCYCEARQAKRWNKLPRHVRQRIGRKYEQRRHRLEKQHR